MLDIDKALCKALDDFADNEKFFLFYLLNADALVQTQANEVADDLYMSICCIRSGYDQASEETLEILKDLEDSL
jgi:UDP-N-acetyl-D-mannosaminuronic acid transferase (WecB/TagA/CpsF family)